MSCKEEDEEKGWCSLLTRGREKHEESKRCRKVCLREKLRGY